MPSAIQQILFAKTAIPRLERALDITAARHGLLTQNIANAETPGYVRKDVNFQAELKAAVGRAPTVGIKTTRAGHMAGQGSTGNVRVIRTQPADKGQSAVQLDQEVAKQAENQLEFNISAHLARGKFESLKTAIRGRR